MRTALLHKSFIVATLLWGALVATVFPAHGIPSHTSGHSTKVPHIAIGELHSRKLVPDAVFQQYQRVAWCETHSDWDRNQPNFDGGLGISRVVWVEYGGTEYAPAPHLATPYAQVAVAVRIQHGLPVPDANGCHAW